MDHIFWKAYSHAERLATIQQIREAVGVIAEIIDFSMFSDLSLAVSIEVRMSGVGTLYKKLQEIVTMDVFEWEETASEKEYVIFLHIAFSSGKGSLEIPVPAVPG